MSMSLLRALLNPYKSYTSYFAFIERTREYEESLKYLVDVPDKRLKMNEYGDIPKDIQLHRHICKR